MRDPHSLWTIETATRGIQEREKTRKAEDEVKRGLDLQVEEHARMKELDKEQDLVFGRKLIEDDMRLIAREAQLAAFKRHEMTKVLREAWTKQ